MAFLKEYLPIWNGQDNIDTILGLLSYLPITSFDDAYSAYFIAAEQAVSNHGVAAHVKLIDFYTSILRHQMSSAYAQESGRAVRNKQILKDLAAHVATLSTSILLSLPSPPSNTIVSSILSFYELRSSSLGSQSDAIPRVPIVLPPMHIIYLLAQDTSLTTLSRTCGILASYKNAFDQHPKPVSRYYPEAITSTFNSCLRDVYNILWVSKALIAAEQKSAGLYCDPELRSSLHEYLSTLDREYSIEKAFNLSNNAWLASLSAAAWRAIEDGEIEREGYDKNTIRYHQGPVSKASLEVLKLKGGVRAEWDGPDGYKVLVLRWLADRGLDGIKNLMFAIATNLRGKV